jgi:hypothetical protein
MYGSRKKNSQPDIVGCIAELFECSIETLYLSSTEPQSLIFGPGRVPFERGMMGENTI